MVLASRVGSGLPGTAMIDFAFCIVGPTDEYTNARQASTRPSPSGAGYGRRSALRGEREEDAALPVSWRRWTPVIQRARR